VTLGAAPGVTTERISPTMQSPLAPAGRRRRRLSLLALGAAAAAAALAPGGAHAAFQAPYTTACSGASVAGIGSSLQKNAQQLFNADFHTAASGTNLSCGSSGPGTTYVPKSSGPGRAALGSGGGGFDFNYRFGGTDVGPNASTEIPNMNKGPDGTAGTADDGAIHTVPVLESAVAGIVHLPDGCPLPTNTSFGGSQFELVPGPGGDGHDRIALTTLGLNNVFAAATGNVTWGALGLPSTSNTTAAIQDPRAGQMGFTPPAPETAVGMIPSGTPCNTVPIIRVVRADKSGTTAVFQQYLNTASGGAAFAADQTPTWPMNSGSTEVYLGQGSGGQALAGRVATQSASIGYVDLSDGRGAFAMSSAGKPTFWLPAQDGGGTVVDPAVDPPAPSPFAGKGFESINPTGSNCANTQFTSGHGAPTTPASDPTLGDWSNTQLVGSMTGYGICTLTYDIAFDDNYPEYYLGQSGASYPGEQAKARTLVDYLTDIVGTPGLAPQPQNDLLGADYYPLPTAMGNNVLATAQTGVAAIGWDKGNKGPIGSGGGGGGGGGTVTPPPNTGGGPPPPVVTGPPSNAFSITSATVNRRSGRITFSVRVPGPGSVLVTSTAKYRGHTVNVGSASATTNKATTLTLSFNPSGSAQAALKKGKKLSVSFKVTFTPVGGSAASQPSSLRLTYHVTPTRKHKKAKKHKKHKKH